jgi:hypothetical protein
MRNNFSFLRIDIGGVYLGKKKINFKKILANSLEVFFTCIGGLLTADAFLNLSVPITIFLLAALVPAAVQSGLTFCHEWSKAEEENIGKNVVNSVSKAVGQFSYKLSSRLSNWVFFE